MHSVWPARGPCEAPTGSMASEALVGVCPGSGQPWSVAGGLCPGQSRAPAHSRKSDSRPGAPVTTRRPRSRCGWEAAGGPQPALGLFPPRAADRGRAGRPGPEWVGAAVACSPRALHGVCFVGRRGWSHGSVSPAWAGAACHLPGRWCSASLSAQTLTWGLGALPSAGLQPKDGRGHRPRDGPAGWALCPAARGGARPALGRAEG